MRTLVLLMLLVACDHAALESGTMSTSSDEPDPAPTSSASDEPLAVVPTTDARVSLSGVVMTDLGSPIVRRPFITLDANGERRDGVTGPGGALALEGLTPPYDLVVMGDGTTGPTLFLGVARTDPHVELRERDGVSKVARALTIRVGVLAPSCGEERCVVDVVSTSLSGHGRTSILSEPTVNGEATAIVEVTHSWSAEQPIEGEHIAIHALVHDEAKTSFAYARLGAFEAGEDSDVGFMRATALRTCDSGAGASLAMTLDVPGVDGVPGAAFSIGARVPLLEGASWRMRTREVNEPTALVLHRSSEVWSGSLALVAMAPPLTLPVVPPITHPVAGGSLSARGGGLSWDITNATLSTVDVADLTRGAFRYRIITNGTDIPFGRLESLGLTRLQPGSHTLELATAAGIPLDDTLSPDPAIRAMRFDERRAGSATYQRIPFVAAP